MLPRILEILSSLRDSKLSNILDATLDDRCRI